MRRWHSPMVFRPRENVYRDVLLICVIVFLIISAGRSSHTARQARDASRQATTAIREQKQGRHFAVGATCAAISAITEAGRQVISPPQHADTPFERALERLGYPPANVRHAQAERAARMYVQHISQAVQRQVGPSARHLVRTDGTIDCRELQRLSATNGKGTP